MDVIQPHHYIPADRLPELQHWLSQYILGPLFLFEKGTGPKVELDLCWRLEDAVYESMKERGFKVLVNGSCDRGYGTRP